MREKAEYIIPECYVDTNLIETLLNAGCNHQKGCNQVAGVMKGKFADRFAVGIIDGDKRRPGYLDEFDELGSTAHLKAYRHRERAHYIIVINPAIEKLIIDSAEAASISLEDYDLAPDLEGLKQQTKRVMSNRDDRFKRLFMVLKEGGDMMRLRDLLGYLREHRYECGEEIVKEILRR